MTTPTTLIDTEICISEMEAKVAVLNHTYHHTTTKGEFMELLAAQTSFPPNECEIAWELLDYIAWQSGGKVHATVN